MKRTENGAAARPGVRSLGGRGRTSSPLRSLLVSGDEFHASLALVRALRAGGYEPFLAVTLPGTYASRSRTLGGIVRVPHAEETPAAFAEAMAGAAHRLGVEAILPGTEASLIALSGHRELLPCQLGAPSPEIVDLATDKERVLALAARHGLHTPPSVIGSPAELSAQAETIEYPAILKPPRTRLEVDGCAGDSPLAYYKAQKVLSPRQLRDALDGLPDAHWVVQPYLSGRLSAICGVAWEGRLEAAVHQVSQRIWPPQTGYSCCAETVAPDPAAERCVAALLSEIGWSGLFQVQFVGSPDGRRFVIDFNPRAYGSLALAVGAGANLPALWAARVLGDRPLPVHYRAGVRYRLEHNDLRAVAVMLRERDMLAAATALLPHRRTAHAVFSLSDPLPLLTTAEKLFGKRHT